MLMTVTVKIENFTPIDLFHYVARGIGLKKECQGFALNGN
jgi:hypothetical protein